MSGIKIIHQNKRVGYDYELLEKVEAGIVLVGTEVKSIRSGKANITEAFVTINNGEAWLHQMQIAHYSHGNQFNHEEFRKRKLLLSRKQIDHMALKSQKEGLHIIALSLYFKDSLVKISLALAKGKKLYDKRESERKKEAQKNFKQGYDE